MYEVLGRGTYSVVYKGRKKGSVEYVAVHCAEKVKRRELQNIVRLTHELCHPNIVKFYEWYETTNHIWMIVELCTGQNLSAMLEQDACFPEATVRQFGADIVNGLYHLHSLGILYCDLRCSKLILDGSGKVKLSNFSLAKVEGEEEFLELEERDEEEEYRRPSPSYMAPEVLQGKPHSISSDLWSLGCVLFELFTGKPPFDADSFPELVNKVLTKNFLYPLQIINAVEIAPSDAFYSLLQSLLCKDLSLRMNWEELSVHPFWDGVLELTQEAIEEEQDEAKETDTRKECEEMEEKEVRKDPMSVNEKLKISLENTIVKGSNTGTHHSRSKRPETAPESSSIKHGTYRVEEMRPYTAESGLNKTRKISKGQKADLLKVSSCTKKLNTPKKNHQTKHGSGLVINEGSKISLSNHKPESRTAVRKQTSDEIGMLDSGDNLYIEHLLYHPSDFIVSSIIDNPKIKKVVVPKWDAKALGIVPLTAEQILEQSEDKTVEHFSEICKLLKHVPRTAGVSGTVGQRSKLHLSSYLASILHNTDVANMVANSSMVPALLQLLKQSSSVDLKGRLGKNWLVVHKVGGRAEWKHSSLPLASHGVCAYFL